MIFHWVNHQQLKNYEKLICILYDCGMATVEQLMIVTGWGESLVRKNLMIISNMEDGKNKDKWLLKTASKRTIIGQPSQAYYLGPRGMKYALLINGNQTSSRVSSPAQLHHYLRTLNIVIRLIEAGVSRDLITWNSPHECIAMVYSLWERRVRNLDFETLKKLSRPDARLAIGDQAYWIEFDNDTEGSRMLEKKFQRYVNTIAPYKFEHRIIHETPLKKPVLWVTISEKRRKFLENIWGAVCKSIYRDYDEDQLPTMYFFVEAEETSYFENRTMKVGK